MNKHLAGIVMGLALLPVVSPPVADAARLKDVVDIEGVRDNPLTGFGLVVGLSGTGDSSAVFTNKSLQVMLERLGISMQDATRMANVASVMVTSSMPPFARQGTKLDVTLSSVGDAKSLQGGTLIMTPLKGADGRVYAVAQGGVVLGGSFAAGANQTQTKNHPTVARIAGGAIIEREIPFALNKENTLQLSLRNPDFTTANRVVSGINELLGNTQASALDSGTVVVTIPPAYHGKLVSLISRMENIQVDPDQPAKVVVNERTGTIVMGENVRVSTVALAHGNLSIKVSENPAVSQPPAFSQGQTAVVENTQIQQQEGDHRVIQLNQGVSLGDLVRNLNKIGVTPRDLITILQSIKAAGALQADLEVL
ncbi:MAG: flagellar basal body P-ring protein FlgI [Magnetococcales bacterium]|nr:flagellar basal body P-ring protein FlgI [Magnetococcales bacterium]